MLPLCPFFGPCGGCAHQNLSHQEELVLKEENFRKQFLAELQIDPSVIQPIVASPKEYHYRHRLDLALRRIKTGEILFGFVGQDRRTIPVDQCPIAMKSVSDFLPELKKLAMETLPASYKVANITVKTGDDGRVLWGGIGRGSLRKNKEEYLWTEVDGKKIFYSLDTFFQANLSILPQVRDIFLKWSSWKKEDVLLDIYGGVGLFSLLFSDHFSKIINIEQSSTSTAVAEFNKEFHHLDKMEILTESAETAVAAVLQQYSSHQCHAIIDPPRKGLSPDTLATLNNSTQLASLFYLSCNPETLLRDLKILQEKWSLIKIAPLDFFPKTSHLEVLTLLVPKNISSSFPT